MEFGRVTMGELETIDFTLPREPERNLKVLPGKPAQGKIYLGLPKWGRTEWVGNLYPTKTKEKEFLSHYVKYFNAVELNATHYKLFGSSGIGRWADAARGFDFKFCPKMYNGITHKGLLTGKEFILKEFLNGVETFGDHLGPIFIQLSETFSARRKRELFEFLESLPSNFPFFLEIRHPDLLTNNALFDYLQTKGIGIVITDTAGRRDCAHMNLTLPKTMIRFISNPGHRSDHTRIEDWSKRLKCWLDKGIEEIYFFLHVDEVSDTLEMVQYITETFNRICGANLTTLDLH
jgi:uncharacterized protein YecE (DUF72 family)